MSSADRDLSHLQPKFKAKVDGWLKSLIAAGISLHISETLRSFERSDELYAQGRTKPGSIVTRAKAGQSYHNFGFAVDCYPILDGKPVIAFDRKPEAMDIMRKAADLAKPCGIDWGGRWIGFKDLPHFQDSDAPDLGECRRKWPKGYIPKEDSDDWKKSI